MTSPDDTFDPLDHLRAADPAREVHPSDGFEQRVLDAALADELIAAEPVTSAPVNLAEERARRRRPSTIWLAAGAAAVVFGCAGYGLGGALGQGGTLPEAVATSGVGYERAPMNEAQVARDSMMGWARYEFSASNLGQEGSQAAVYRFQPEDIDEARANAMAGLFGVTEPLTRTDFGWNTLGDKPSSLGFGISIDQYGSMYFYDPTAGPQTRCYQVAADQATPDATQSDGLESSDIGGEEQQQQIEQCLQAAMEAAPSGETAAATLTETLTQMGFDPVDYEISGQDQTEIYADGASASANLLIDGYPSTIGFSMTLSADGIVSFNGMLGTPVKIGDYPLVSPQGAFERLSDPRFGASSVQWAYGDGPVMRDQTLGSAQQSGPESSGAASENTPLIHWPVQPVHIDSAELTYTVNWDDDGSSLLVPAYSFTDTEGRTWSMIALAEEALDFTPSS